MGRIDARTKEYMSDKAHFADVFNFFLYGGRDVIKPDRLREMDSTALALPFGKDAKSSDVLQKIRDVFKGLAAMGDGNAVYVLLGIENQSFIHYAISVKNMLYDAVQYAKQVDEAAKSHREYAKNHPGKACATSDEFLSGFHKDDRLTPVITLVVFWSPEKWNGPRSIHEMLAVKDKEVLKYVPDYKINLVAPNEISDSDFRKFHTALGKAFQFIKHSDDKEKLKELMANDQGFKSLDRRTVELINDTTSANIKIPKGAKEVDVCIAIEGMKKEAAEEAAEKATNETIMNNIKNLMNNMKWTAEQAMEALGIASDERKRLLPLL